MHPPLYPIRPKKDPAPFEHLEPGHFSLAEPVGFHETVSGRPARQQGEARLLYDDKSLYAFFDLKETAPLATHTRHDAPLYEENVVELFLDPLGLGSIYYELEINPLNTSFDAIIVNDIRGGARRGPRFQGFTEWDPKSFRHRSVVTGDAWRVFCAIDFDDLFLAKRIPPKKGDEWRGNILRIDFNGRDTEFDAWSPAYVLDFHQSARFGVFRFE